MEKYYQKKIISRWDSKEFIIYWGMKIQSLT